VQNRVNAQNVSLAHLQHEQAVLANAAGASGRTFAIADPGAAPSFADTYNVMRVCNGVVVTQLPPVLVLAIAYALEAYALLLARFAGLAALGFAEVAGPLAILQPSVMTTCTAHQYCFDGPARKSVEEGGLGYRGVGTSLDGMVNQAVLYNQETGRNPSWET